MGENPVVSDPDTEHVIHALEKAFVITQDLFLNETSEYADVVFDVATFEASFLENVKSILIADAEAASGEGLSDEELDAILLKHTANELCIDHGA